MPYVVGGKNNSSTTSNSSSSGGYVVGGSKKPKADPLAKPVRPTQMVNQIDITQNPFEQFTDSSHTINGPLEMDDATVKSKWQINEERGEKARTLPVIGPILKGLDWVGEKTEPAAELMRSFYVPGGGIGNIAGLTGAAESAVSRLLPKWGNSVLGRIGQKGISEAIVGAPLGVGQTQMVNPDASTSDLLKGAAWGAGGGAVLGGLGKSIGEAGRYARETIESVADNAFKGAPKNNRTISSPFMQGVADNPIAKGYTEQVSKTFGNTTRTRMDDIPSSSPIILTEPPVSPVIEQPVTNMRSNFKNQRENGNFSDDFYRAQNERDLTYEPVTNKETIDEVNKMFSEKSVDDIRASFQNPETKFSAQHTATGYRLMQELDRVGRYEDAVNVAEKLASDLTAAGQQVQAASVLSRLSPEGQLLQLTREAKKSGKTLDPKDYARYGELAGTRQNGVSAGPKAAQFYDLLDRMKKGETVSAAEMKSSVETMLEEAKKHIKATKEAKPRVRDKVLSYLEKEAEAARKELGLQNNLGFAAKIDGTPAVVLWSKIMAHELAKKAVNIADFTELLVKQAGEPLRPFAKEIYDRANKLIGKADKINVDKVKILDKFLKEGKFSEVDEKSLRSIANDLEKLQGKQGLQADMQMQKILNKYQKSTPWGMTQTLRYMMMLLNESTQSLNAISGPLMMTYRHMLDYAITPFDIALNQASKLSKGKFKWDRTTTINQGPGYFDHMFTPMVEWFKGLPTGARAGWQGVDPEGIMSQHDIRGRQFKDKFTSWNLGMGERLLGAVSKGPDYATYNASRNREMRKLANLDAINKGIKGREAKQAHIDKFLSDPPEAAKAKADREGKKTTFQYDEGAAGLIRRKYGKALTPVSPFVRTPTNIGITGMENTPAGILKGFYEIYRLHTKPDSVSKREILQTFASSTVGGTLALGGTGYLLENLGIITGDYESSDRNNRAIDEANGKGRFKFNTSAFGRMFDALTSGEDMEKVKEVSKYRKGDRQLDYNRLQPFAMPVAAGATLSQQKTKDKTNGEALAKAGKSSLSSLFGMSALQGINQTFDTKDNLPLEDKAGAVLNNIAENYTKSYSPSFLARDAQRQDPVQRQTSFQEGFKKDVLSYYQSRLPKNILGFDNPFNSTKLPERVTNLGDVKKSADPYLNTLKAEETLFNEAAKIIYEVREKTGDMKLAPNPMEKSYSWTKKGEKEKTPVTLDKFQHAQLQKNTGQEITKRIVALPPEKRTSKYIEQIYTDVRSKKLNDLKKQLGFKVE